MNQKVINLLSEKLRITTFQVNKVLSMLQEGNTIPFISRYRQDETKGLNEEQIFEIEKEYKYNVELEIRKESIIEILKEKDLLTNEIKNAIFKAQTKSELEAIYEPFKVGKITKASQAISLGLKPLADSILNNKNPKFNIHNEASKYLNDKITSIDFAIEQANFIIAQNISQDVKVRDFVKKYIIKNAHLKTKRNKSVEDPENKFLSYYKFDRHIRDVKNYNILAINRASKLKIITKNFEYKKEPIINGILRIVDKHKINEKNLLLPLQDALKRLILTSIETEIFNELFEIAQHKAIQIFANSVEKLLTAPATYGHTVLSIDPGYKNGCKIAVLNPNGDVLKVDKIFPSFTRFYSKENNNQPSATGKLKELFAQFPQIDIVVIGNGTASQETERFIAEFIKKRKIKVKWTVVSEVGASVYSASKVAQEEFPNLSVEERSAINIGRKFLDPLNELVKIDPKSIGVGQYQHDVNQKELEESLNHKVNKVVNETGVDLNSATKSILSYVSGLNKANVEKILEHRRNNGVFTNRKQLLSIKGLGEKTYQQCIGFLRIFNSDNFLDKTFIHPESYDLANKIINKYNLIPNEKGIDVSHLNIEQLIDEFNSNEYDIKLILDALSNPIKNFDKDKTGFLVKDFYLDEWELNPGNKLKGTVENVTDFGLFIYIGLKKHLFVPKKDANLLGSSIYEQFYVGMIVDTEIVEIDEKRHRISGKIIDK
ncbi:helix-hairpin-helix domain-containing protein [Mycoplasma sp. 5912]